MFFENHFISLASNLALISFLISPIIYIIFIGTKASFSVMILRVHPGIIYIASILFPLTSNSFFSPVLMFLSWISPCPDTTINCSHLELCQCWPLVIPGFDMFIDTWPQSRVRFFSTYWRQETKTKKHYRVFSAFSKQLDIYDSQRWGFQQLCSQASDKALHCFDQCS